MIKLRPEETKNQPKPHHESLSKWGESHHLFLGPGTQENLRDI